MRGEAKVKFFVLLMAMIIVISPYRSMTFAADETANDRTVPGITEEQVLLQDTAEKKENSGENQSNHLIDEHEPAEKDETLETTELPEHKESEKEGEPESQEKSEYDGLVSEATVDVTNGEENEDILIEEYLRTEEVTELKVEKDSVMLYAAGKSSISDGDTINYTVTRIGEDNHKPFFHSDDYEGMCIEPGKEANDNGGKATVKALSKSDIRVKTAYYMSVVLNYWPTGKGNDNTLDVNKQNARINRAERAVQYASNPKKTMERMKELNYSQELIDSIIGYVETARGITVPESFEAFECDPSTDNQGFILYKYHGGKVTLKKQSESSAYNLPVNYSLADAIYYAYTDAACTFQAYDRTLNPIIFHTDLHGNTETYEVPAGTYYLKEVKASKGHLLDTAVCYVNVTDANTESNPAEVISREPPTWGELFKLRKIDKSGKNGWKYLLGTKYRISYYDVDPSTTDVSGVTAKRSWIFETVRKTDERTGDNYAGIDFTSDQPLSGDAFYTENGKRILPCGVFTIEESEAPAGIARDTTVYYGKVYQPSNGADAVRVININNAPDMPFEIGSSDNVINQDKPQSIKIAINKMSAYTGTSLPDGSEREAAKGSLAGAVYDVYYDNPRKPKPEKIGTIVTDENGYGEISEYDGEELDLGRYYIEEVKASDGYVIDGLYFKDEPGKYENGRHVVDARAIEMNTGNFIYRVESLEPPHVTHVYKKTITGEELPGATLEVIDSEGNILEEWVSTTEPHDILALHDETQGLKDGKYTLREITAPYGYDIAEDVEFTVSSNKIENTVEMKNAPVEIETNAKDAETQTRVGTFSAEEKIVDVVTFRNLYAGRTYTFKGTLMDKEKKEALKDKDGNEVIAEKEYTPEGKPGELVSGSLELEFTVDSSGFTKGKSIVAFETVYREGRELGVHADLNDENQTIWYGHIIGTIAQEKSSLEHNLLAGPEGIVADTVKYEGLATGEEYTVIGELYDKNTGKLTGITAETSFRPATSEGSVIVLFKFDATDYASHSLVAFERLIHKDKEIDKHEDPDDPDQTIYVPEVSTKLGELKDGTITDIVRYKNLIPGKTYIVSGYLVQKETDRPVPDSSTRITFVPQTPDGEVKVELNCRRGHGKVVAFEYLYISGDNGKKTLVGKHTDISSKEQSYTFPSSPKTGDDTMLLLYTGIFILSAGLCIMKKLRLRRR